jgi:hypothetical protein
MYKTLYAITLLFSSVGLFNFNANAQALPRTGALFNAQTIANTPRKILLSTRSLTSLPSSHTLEPYCPTAGDQGNTGTCVAYANAYGIATILYAKTHEITDKAVIDKYAFSSSYLYEQIKDPTDKDCQMGSDPIMALLKMMDGGNPFMKTVANQCNTIVTEAAKREAANYKILDAAILFAAPGMMVDDLNVLNNDEMIAVTKKALLEGSPISTGWHIPKSFFHVKSDVWNVSSDDQLSDLKHNGHAMAVIGYDDNKYGGAFRILNSWGTGWANRGLVWVKYSDFTKWCKLAIQVFADPFTPTPQEAKPTPPPPAPTPTPQPKPAPPAPKPTPPPPVEKKFSLSGNVYFKLNTGEDMPVNQTTTRNLMVDDDKAPAKEDLVAYTMANSYTSGTAFRFYIEVDKEAYIYAFATDLSGKVNLILPFDEMISTHVGANSTIAFPSDKKVVRLDQNKGTDYLMILYSAEKLDAKKIAADMNAMSGPFSDKIKKVLGKKLMDKSVIKYATDRVGFSANGTATRNLSVTDDDAQTVYAGGTVVPLMVEIKHN